MIEIWKAVVGYEGRYEVSDLGRIKSLPHGRRGFEKILKQTPHVKSGHLLVNLSDNEQRQRVNYVHLLVLIAHVGLPPKGMQGCHNDGVPANNALSNLRWDTPTSNQADRKLHGTSNVGEQNPMAKFDEATVRVIKERLSRGELVTNLAKEYGVRHGAISLIKNGKRWAGV